MFLYRLALAIGVWDVEGLKRQMSVRQVLKWQAYWRVEPFGDEWRRSAREALTAAAAFGAKPEPDSEDKFLPNYREKPQTLEEVRAELSKIPAFRKQMETE